MDNKKWLGRYAEYLHSEESTEVKLLSANGLLEEAARLLSIGGEIEQTLAWHKDVNEAREREFGEQPLYEKLLLASTLVREETQELEDELFTARSYLAQGQSIPLEVKAAAAKEAADVLFVVAQAVYTLGVPFGEAYAEVLRSNRSKLEGGIRFRDDGKLLKGELYTPADVLRVLETHEKPTN